MEIITQVVPDDFNLFLFGDLHRGSVHFCQTSYNRFLNTFESPFDGVSENYAVNQGDNIEALATDDRRFDLTNADLTGWKARESFIDAQIQSAIDLLKPLGERLVVVLKGNHEHTIERITNAGSRIASGLGVPYGTYSVVINYVDKNGSLLFKHYATHGRKQLSSIADDPVRQRANMELQLKRAVKSKFGDTLLNSMGHAHKIITAKPRPQLYLTTGEDIEQRYTKPRKRTGYIEPNHKWYACTGSFLRTFVLGVDGYAERAGYDPVELGCVVAKIRDREIVDLVELPLSHNEITETEEAWVAA